jgi:hypothetical protein
LTAEQAADTVTVSKKGGLNLTFSDDEMRWTDPTPSIGGTIENVWTRTQ